MPTDAATQTVEIAAAPEQVLAVLRDVQSQPRWVREIREAELLDSYDDGRPATARFRASSPVGTDEYTLSYEHSDDGMSWSMLKGRLQTGQEGRYVVRPTGDGRSEVTFSLTISHNLPLPGFVRQRVVKGLVSSTVTGLKDYLETTAPPTE